MKLKCDECGKPSRVKTKVKKMKDKIHHIYFRCEHCNHMYTVGYTDDEIRTEHKKIRKLIDKRNKQNFDNHELNEQIKALNISIERKMKELGAKYKEIQA